MFTKACPFEREVSELSEGTLPPERAEAVRSHLASCPFCSETDRTRQRLSGLMRENDPAAYLVVSADTSAERLRAASLRAALLERCQPEQGGFQPRRYGHWAFWLGGTAAVAGLLLLGGIILHRQENATVTTQSRPSVSQRQDAKGQTESPGLPVPAPPRAPQKSQGVVVKARVEKQKPLPDRTQVAVHLVRPVRRKSARVKASAISVAKAPIQVAQRAVIPSPIPQTQPIRRAAPEPEHLVLIMDGNPEEMSSTITTSTSSTVTVVAMRQKTEPEEPQGSSSMIRITKEENHP